jgi:hypothetical protein
LPVGSAAGPSAWTYAAIRAIFFENEGVSEAVVGPILSMFCNAMLAGKLQREVWLRSRAILIPKKDGSWRPLCIGEAWYRFVGRAAMLAHGKIVGEVLSPLQLGCGISSGCEIAGRIGQIALATDPNIVLISLDLKNAFSTLRRKLVMRGILRSSPNLAKWFIGCATLSKRWNTGGKK